MPTHRFVACGISIALHLLVLASMLRHEALPTRTEASTKVVLVSRSTLRPTPATPAPAAPKKRRVPDDLGIRLSDEAAALHFRDFSFDANKVVQQAALLFPFLTDTLSLDPDPDSDEARKRARHSLHNPFSHARRDDITPPLALSDDAMQSIVDHTWSRRERWTAFQPIAAYTNAYHPDEGRLPTLIERYVTQNALQPYVDTTIRDPRLWTELGLAADHHRFIEFISGYAEQHPSTKTTTELLFLLAMQAEASQDALITLMDIAPDTDLRWTHDTHPAAYSALVAIRRHYANVLAAHGLTTRSAVIAHYDATRLAILSTIIRTTPHGFRASDARFMRGQIYWKQFKRADARREWLAMEPAADDSHAAAATELLQALRTADVGKAGDARRIDRILDTDRGLWISLSYERLRKFGYQFDTF